MADIAAILDLGKTNLKLLAIDSDGRVLDSLTAGNRPAAAPPYLHLDARAVWDWLLPALQRLAARHPIRAIVPCAYGSTAALIDGSGLVLPIMDYEADPPEEIKAAYAEAAPSFDEACAPTNPGGLTLGRQVFWQSRAFPEEFGRVRHILPNAQFWAWRLSGVAATEVTSLGAQTHLWAPKAGDYSSLVDRQGWRPLFPPMRKAWDVLGPITPEVAAATGLPPETPVLCGIHDSSANYLRYLAAGMSDFTLMSTGTWVINFNAAQPLDGLDPARDTCSNTDIHGNPIACSRFMGGREFDILADGAPPEAATLDDVAALIAAGTMALPSFTDSGGPFPGTGGKGRIVGPEPKTPAARVALATLYTALMCSESIDVIGSTNDVVIDGALARNDLFCRLLADLRLGQTIRVSTTGDGTALGASRLCWWQDAGTRTEISLSRVTSPTLGGLADHEAMWRELSVGHVAGSSERIDAYNLGTTAIPEIVEPISTRAKDPVDVAISSTSQKLEVEVDPSDPISPSDVRRSVQEIREGDQVFEHYECTVYEFERDGAFCEAREDHLGSREVTILGPYSVLDRNTKLDAPEFRADVLAYLKRRYDVILELRGSGYARVWRRPPRQRR